jgi:hypothetical protein
MSLSEEDLEFYRKEADPDILYATIVALDGKITELEVERDKAIAGKIKVTLTESERRIAELEVKLAEVDAERDLSEARGAQVYERDQRIAKLEATLSELRAAVFDEHVRSVTPSDLVDVLRRIFDGSDQLNHDEWMAEQYRELDEYNQERET